MNVSNCDQVMRALRDDPLGGAAVATRYCSPSNRASELSPETFARYLQAGEVVIMPHSVWSYLILGGDTSLSVIALTLETCAR